VSEVLGLWTVGPNRAEIAPADEGSGIRMEMLYSGISRGTERLVHAGEVPESEHERMRAPFQEGDFPYPVKYGYNAVARIVEGADAGTAVFALFPHQTRFRLPEDAFIALPKDLPPERAILGANMETALNIVWDSGAGAGDRITIMGAGVVGLLTAYLSARLPGAEVTLCDIDPGRAELARALGCRFATPDRLVGDQDVIVNASASGEALATAIHHAGMEATLVEASWYGAKSVTLPLGGAFHSRRLRLVSSQVGQIPLHRARRWTYRRRLAKALDLLCDARLDALISGETDFTDLPLRYSEILHASETLCHRVRYA
jgi:threonine dehydrogenase-like Zn-dependent dehydrogenase